MWTYYGYIRLFGILTYAVADIHKKWHRRVVLLHMKMNRTFTRSTSQMTRYLCLINKGTEHCPVSKKTSHLPKVPVKCPVWILAPAYVFLYL